MNRCIAFLVVVAFVLLTRVAVGAPLVDVQTTDNGDGTHTYWVSVNPNTGLDEVAFIDTSINSLSGGFDQFLERDSYQEVHLTGDQALASAMDPTYPVDRDTVFADQHWPAILALEIVRSGSPLWLVDPPAPQPSHNGRRSMRVAAASFTGGLGGPVPGDEYIPIWHVTTRGELEVEGVIQTESQPDGYFYWSTIPEPSSALLVSLAAWVTLLTVRSRRR